MNLAELLFTFDKGNERHEALRQLRSWLSIALDFSRRRLGDSQQSRDLRAHFDSFPPQKVVELAQILSHDSPEAISGPIEDARAVLTSPGEPNYVTVQRRLADADSKLKTLHRRHRIRSALISAAKVGVYAGPIVVAYLVGTYFRFYDNVYSQSLTIVQPAAAHEENNGRYIISKEYLERFYPEFSKYYFRRSNTFSRQFVSSLDGNPSVLDARLVFRNPRGAEHLLISTVAATATVHHVPFDWSWVDVTAKVDVDYDTKRGGERVSFEDSGIGPALNVTYNLSTGPLVVWNGVFDQLYQRAEWRSLRSTGADIAARDLVDADSDDLTYPVFWAVTQETIIDRSDAPIRTTTDRTSASLIRCRDGRLFEKVSSVSRLSQLTRTVRGGMGAVNISYESLRGDVQKSQIPIPLPRDLLFVERTPALNEQDDPCRQVVPPPPVPPLSPSAPMHSLIDKLSGLVPRLEGVDLIKASVRLHLKDLRDGSVATGTAHPEEILNPGGFLLLRFIADEPKNGFLNVTVHVNGAEVHAFDVQTLIPEQWFYSGDFVRERQVFWTKAGAR